MKKMMISVLAAVAVFSAIAEERITYKASDGVNNVTARIREDGMVIPETVTLAYVEPPLQQRTTDAETQKQLDGIKEELRVLAKSEKPDVERVDVYRIHLYRNTDGSEVAYVVGSDGVARPVVLLDPLEYRLLTERLDAVWQSFHSTADGRRKLHGKLERTEIDEKARQKVEIYADGFRHTETLPAKRKPTEVKITRLQAKIEEQKPKGMSDKRWEMRQAFKKHRLGIPKQVTVEHDAATGKDTVVK